MVNLDRESLEFKFLHAVCYGPLANARTHHLSVGDLRRMYRFITEGSDAELSAELLDDEEPTRDLPRPKR